MKPYYDEDGITIYHGRAEDVLPTLPTHSAQVVVTSPPYNQLGTRVAVTNMNRGMHQTNGWLSKVEEHGYADELSETDYAAWQADIASLLSSVVVPGGSFFYNHKLRYRDSRPLHPIDIVRAFDGWWLRQELVWDRRGSMVLNARMFAPSDERIYWMVRDGAPHQWNQDAAGYLSVWPMVPPGGSNHPCPFPSELAHKCIAATTRVGEMVLDPFMGSGTTIQAAYAADRRAIGIEIEERYCEIAVQRLAQGVLSFD